VFRRVAVLAAAALCLAPAAAAATLTPSESALLREMNRVRAGYHLAPLRYDRRLELAARFHSREMLQSGMFQHGAFGSRMARVGISALVGPFASYDGATIVTTDFAG
jgi:uncharacterized protein YkwD